MILLKLINGTEIVLNSDLIEFVEATPDTVISLSNGKKFIVRETVEEVIDKIVEFRRRIVSVPSVASKCDKDHNAEG
jgi:flagellar protein FlbD